MKTVIALLILLTISLQARTWTDINGRKIEAEMMRPDGDQVVVSMGGKEINIPRSKLSKEDLDFADGWKSPELTLAGQVILKGGKANVIERDYSPEALRAIKTDKSGFTGDFAPNSKQGPSEGEGGRRGGILEDSRHSQYPPRGI